MKLVEIKNSLAKLYYEPALNPLVISDFLTIDDSNKKILAQVISIESTSNDNTNCAILKFSLDLDNTNSFGVYSGYIPSLDSQIYKTGAEILQKIFSNSAKTINIGELTNTSGSYLNLNASILDNFLYIQSDVSENTKSILEKIIESNNTNLQKTLLIDFDNINSFKDANVIELGKDFKLPIGVETLNYIYENDLTGLTVEQKAIVQDILLEIQDYINTLESGYIPFNTLMDVVDSVYESDKSVGVILLRNKLIKYKQSGIFASSQEEIDALNTSIQNHTITVLNASNFDTNWKKETTSFIVNNLQENFFMIMVINDENTDKNIINSIYKADNIKPVILSSYDCTFAHQLKSFAKNLILFKPLEQQKSFAAYNSFLTKLSQKEFIVSGEATYYTPLIIREIPDSIQVSEKVFSVENNVMPQETEPDNNDNIIDFPEAVTVEDTPQTEEIELLDSDEEIVPLEEISNLDEEENNNEIKNIFDESVENEIAKDVDEMLYANPSEITEENNISLPEQTNVESDYSDLLSEADLDVLDEINPPDESASLQNEQNDDLLMLEDDSIQNDQGQNNSQQISDLSGFAVDDTADTISFTDDLPELPAADDLLEDTTSNILNGTDTESPAGGIPVYNAEQDTVQNNSDIRISEGNIVYHEKYGRGVVEELFNYGKRTLCSIQFDNVGRRLLDPNLAELKQM